MENEAVFKGDTKGQIRISRSVPVILLCLILLYGTIYRIDTGQGAILTKYNGEKTPINEVGIHTKMPILSNVNKYSIVNNNIYFPEEYLALEAVFKGDSQAGAIGFDIKTTDDKVVDTGAVMAFEITDLMQFGVKNTNPQTQLQKAYDAAVFNYLQSQTSEKITTDITEVNLELLNELRNSNIEKQFGIKINSVSLLRPTFTKVALDALAEKQAIQARSEGELNAAKNKAEAIEILATAQKKQADILKNVPIEQLDFNAKLALYDTLKGNQNTIWVIPTGQSIVLNK